MNRFRTSLFSCCVVVFAASAFAAEDPWRVALSYGSAGVVIPLLPPAVNQHSTSNPRLADSGTSSLGFELDQDNGPSGLWSERGNGQLLPFAQNEVTGATGPGRSGTEGSHVFRAVHAPMDSIGAGYRVFGGEANDPAAPANDATSGLWQFNGSRNVEIARLGTDGVLGPGIGAGWTFSGFNHISNVSGFANANSLKGGRAVMNARVRYLDNVSDSALVQYVPSVGNVPCMVEGSTNPAWSPGIAGIGAFSGMRQDLSISPHGELYGGASTTATLNQRTGIWRFCDGAPRAQALTEDTGSLGPGLSTTTAYFTDIYARAAPGTAGSLYFTAAGRMSSVNGSPTFLGLFLRRAGVNRPILLRNVEGALGPGVAGHVFSTSIAPYDVKAGGRFAVLRTTIAASGSSSPTTSGLWRISPETGAVPVALAGDSANFAPAPGRSWTGFSDQAIFDNGDIVVLAQVSNPNETSLWRLRVGAAPLRLLGPGDSVAVPFASGTVMRSVTSIFTTAITNLSTNAGTDAWTSADGSVILPVYLQGLVNTVTLRARATSTDLIFTDGLE